MTQCSGFGLIPAVAKVLAGVAFLGIEAFFFWIFDDHKRIGLGTLMGAGLAVVVAAVILLAGYVYADASRRGMPALPWTALAVLVPNALGFVLYFLMRRPIVHPCPRCGSGVEPGAAFCPRCGQRQAVDTAEQPSKTTVGDWG